ncbi:MAG: hypothetical protein IPK06_10280 [Ignavibacteriae bacterium]|nr:hypothetical protein [Ignavibacteriota bacterium]
MGREIKSFGEISKTSGSNEFEWIGTNNCSDKVTSGFYLLKFNAKSLEKENMNFAKTIKLMLLK